MKYALRIKGTDLFVWEHAETAVRHTAYFMCLKTDVLDATLKNSVTTARNMRLNHGLKDIAEVVAVDASTCITVVPEPPPPPRKRKWYKLWL